MLYRPTSWRVVLASAGLVVVCAVAGTVYAGPLRDCCSSKNAFCIMPSRGGAAGCAALGGTFFAANACLNGTRECAVAHQRKATGVIQVQPPAGPPRVINLNGSVDVIDTEMIQLDLTGVDPVAGPVRMQNQAGKASPGVFTPLVESFFDVVFEIGVPSALDAIVPVAPMRLTAAPVGASFPVELVPYVSSSSVPATDRAGLPNGAILAVSLTVLPYPDADADGVEDVDDACPGTPAATRVNDVGCSDAQLCPPEPDTDGDGKADVRDACPGTPSATAVDASGCSNEQFCALQDATTTAGKMLCRKLDWQNDEPKQLPRESDCVVTSTTRGTADDRCSKRP